MRQGKLPAQRPTAIRVGVQLKSLDGEGKRSERELEVAAAQHGGGNAGHDRLRLYVEVTIHFVRSPTPDKANAVAVNARAEHGHGATRPRGAGGVVGSVAPELGVKSNGDANAGGKDGRGDIDEDRRLRGMPGTDGIKGRTGKPALCA